MNLETALINWGQSTASARDLDGPPELVILSVQQKTARCRLRSFGPRSSGPVRAIRISAA
jgi:hypothetical protein